MQQLRVQTDILDTRSSSWLYRASIETNGKTLFHSTTQNPLFIEESTKTLVKEQQANNTS